MLLTLSFCTDSLCVKLEVQPSTIQIGKQLGKGNFGTVYEAKWSGSRVAIKIIQFEQVKNSPITPEGEISVFLLVTIYIANMPVNNIEWMFMSSRHLPQPHITMILVWAKEVPSTFYIRNKSLSSSVCTDFKIAGEIVNELLNSNMYYIHCALEECPSLSFTVLVDKQNANCCSSDIGSRIHA